MRHYLLLLALALAGAAGAQAPAPVTLVKASRLLDPKTGSVLSPAAVLIHGDTIVSRRARTDATRRASCHAHRPRETEMIVGTRRIDMSGGCIDWT